MNGNPYSAKMRRPPAFAASPAEYKLAAFFDAACFSDAVTAAVFKSLFGPSSHVTLSTRRPSRAPQTLSATTATAESPILPTKLTPETFFESLSSKLDTFPPITGHRDRTENLIPGKR